MPSPRQNEDHITEVLNAWKTLRPEKSFGGLTLAQFEAKVKQSFDSRVLTTNLENQLLAAQNQRTTADLSSLAAINLVVNAVKGDPAAGDDGDLYEAMGYKRRSERKSGLRHGKDASAKIAAGS